MFPRPLMSILLIALCALSITAYSEPLIFIPRSINSNSLRPHSRSLHPRHSHAASASHDFAQLDKRQSSGSVMQVDLDEWARETTRKCLEQLKSITKASNPAGIAVCYNLPYLDPVKGVFAADLRMYQISEREGDWELVEDIDMKLEYSAAAVREADLNTPKETPPADGSMPKIVKEFNFLGQIKPEFLVSGSDAKELRGFLIPSIALTARTPGGTNLNTTLASNEATFVNGIFSELTDNNGPLVVEAPPFQLPGTRIEIVPIGLYIFSAYTAIGVSIVMYGTFERRRYRDQYRSRVAKTG